MGEDHAELMTDVEAAMPPRKTLTRRSFSKPQHTVESGGKWEGVDFDVQESTVWMLHHRNKTDKEIKYKTIFSWVNVFIAAILTAFVAFCIDVILDQLGKLKYGIALAPLLLPGVMQIKFVLVFVAFNLVFVGIASGLVNAIEKVAAGSGIPEIKCILNGNKQNGALRMRTLFVKATGVLFSVAGSLPVGKEGPMIMSGAIIGSGIGQGMSSTMNVRAKMNRQFRNDLDKRDQVAAGAAAGVTAAFGSPIGGVLFAIEEGASYWNQGITWRTFFGTMCGALFLDVCMDAYHGETSSDGHFVVDMSYIVEFGVFGTLNNTKWLLIELPLIIILGVICGLLGALFNELQKKLTIWRMKYVPTLNGRRRFVETLVISVLVSLCAACIPLAFPLETVCRSISDAKIKQPDGSYALDVKVNGHLPQFFCPDGYYNEAATLYFQLSEKAILNLFHNGTEFNLVVLITFAWVYFFLAIITYGISVPSGLFVPSLTIGAAFGRFYGQVCRAWFPPLQYTNLGFYALLGAGGMLGGIARLTISATVILLESTQNVSYTVPVMICTMVAKKVADQFNHGLYDIHIHLKKIPLLEEQAPPHSEKVQVRDILTRKLQKFDEIVTVGEVEQVLWETTHNSFPVTRNDGGQFTGLITRGRLCSLLALRSWQKERPEQIAGRQFDLRPGCKIESHEALDHFFPNFPRVEDLELTDEDRACWMDLTPYMNPGAYTVTETAPLSRAFRLFRGLGLRFVPVLDCHHRPVGVITRKCLMEDAIEAGLHSAPQRQAEPLFVDHRTSIVEMADRVRDRMEGKGSPHSSNGKSSHHVSSGANVRVEPSSSSSASAGGAGGGAGGRDSERSSGNSRNHRIDSDLEGVELEGDEHHLHLHDHSSNLVVQPTLPPNL